MKPLDLSILVLNYKTKDITLACLKTIFDSVTKYRYEVIVVDNASGDGSAAAFKHSGLDITVVENPLNNGFAAGNNLGAAKAKGHYLWLLNSDTLIQPDTIETLLDSAYKHDSCLATCQLLNRDGSLQPQGGALPNLLNLTTWMLNLDAIPFIARLIPPYQETRASSFQLPTSNFSFGWIGGTAMLVRRDVYFSLGGLDEHIFMYGEDVEFCLRANRGSVSVDYFAKPRLIHLGQASGNSARAVLGEFSGLKYIYQKHKTPSQYAYLRFILKCGALLRCVIFSLTGNSQRRDIYAKAFKMA